MHYRSDIDGLRAIAVLFVLIFHAGISILPAGFIGVDIFFVISGFLITSIILKSVEDKKFSINNFYARRLWRLQPALIAVLAFTLILASIFYLPDDFITYLKSAKYTSYLISNQYFSRSTTSYAAADTEWLLLLHTWSLSIEWQWYLILPAAILSLTKITSFRMLRATTFSVTVIAIALSMYLSDKYPDKNYYYLTSRIFEFMIGSSVVMLIRSQFKISSMIQSFSGLVSLFVILYCATRRDILLGYPDLNSVMVSVATAVLLFSGASSDGLATRFLSLRPLVFIGTISYSLYLWHWPVFATARYLSFHENAVFIISCFLITFILAWGSYFFIEKPFRKSRINLLSSVCLLVIIPAVFYTTLYAITEKNAGFNARFGEEYLRVETSLKNSTPVHREECLNGNDDGKNSHCLFGDVNSKKRALIFGDSNSNHFWRFIETFAIDAHMSIMAQATSSCLTLPGIYQYNWWHYKNTLYRACHDNTNRYFDNVRNGKFDYVIIATEWMGYAGDHIVTKIDDERSVDLSRARIEKAFDEAMKIIVDSGSKPVIIKRTLPMPEKFMSCFYQHVKLRGTYQENVCNPLPWQGDDTEWFTQVFNKMKIKYPSLIIIDPKDVQCPGDKCRTDINGIPVYRDIGHMTDYASSVFGKEYIEKENNPFR